MKTVSKNCLTVPGPQIRLAGVTFGYRHGRVFDGLTVSIPSAAVTCVVGPNGCGKSTLLSLLAGVLRPQQGIVDVAGLDDVALAVQRSPVSDTFPITVAEAVSMGRWRHLGLLRRPSRSDRDIVSYWMAEFGLTELRDRRLGELSGGQRQRVLLAQAFAQQAPVLLLDEPTTALDDAGVELVLRQQRRLADSGITVVTATHDTALALGADHCVKLAAGAVAAVGPPNEVLVRSVFSSTA